MNAEKGDKDLLKSSVHAQSQAQAQAQAQAQQQAFWNYYPQQQVFFSLVVVFFFFFWEIALMCFLLFSMISGRTITSSEVDE